MVQIDINNDLCVGCKLCVHICPEMVLGMAGGYVANVIDVNRCSQCMVCERECPEEAIRVRER